MVSCSSSQREGVVISGLSQQGSAEQHKTHPKGFGLWIQKFQRYVPSSQEHKEMPQANPAYWTLLLFTGSKAWGTRNTGAHSAQRPMGRQS